MADELITRLTEQRASAWEQAKSLLDHAAAEGRDLSGEESEQFTRINDDIDALDSRRKFLIDGEARERAIDESRSALGLPADFGSREVAAPHVENDSDIIRAIAMGERRNHSFEQRDITKGSTGAPVPTSFYDRLVEHLVVQGPMLDGNVVTMLTTASGENLQIPRTSTYTAPGIVGEGTAIPESDPTFASFVTLGSFKFASTFQLTRELVEDASMGVNLLDFVARQASVGMGTAVNASLTIGTGTTQPNGIVNGASSAVTGGTGTLGGPSADNLIDMVYTCPSPYRRQGAAWQMRSSTLAVVRKLKDTNGQYLWQPALQANAPDQLLGYPVLENPDVAAIGTAAKSVLFGNFASAYYVRQVRGIDVARDDSVGFVNDLITFRVTWRGDGNVVDPNAVWYFKGGTAV
jgi:HK97 family phage major capsid protein